MIGRMGEGEGKGPGGAKGVPFHDRPEAPSGLDDDGLLVARGSYE